MQLNNRFTSSSPTVTALNLQSAVEMALEAAREKKHRLHNSDHTDFSQNIA